VVDLLVQRVRLGQKSSDPLAEFVVTDKTVELGVGSRSTLAVRLPSPCWSFFWAAIDIVVRSDDDTARSLAETFPTSVRQAATKQSRRP